MDKSKKQEFLAYLKKRGIKLKGDYVRIEDADSIKHLYQEFLRETIPTGSLTDEVKKAILEDYKEWSGGYSPSEDDQWDKYVEYALPFDNVNPEEVLEWFGTL